LEAVSVQKEQAPAGRHCSPWAANLRGSPLDRPPKIVHHSSQWGVASRRAGAGSVDRQDGAQRAPGRL